MTNEPEQPGEVRSSEGLGSPARETAAPACQHANKQEKHVTYGYRWWCPDCKARGEDWWD